MKRQPSFDNTKKHEISFESARGLTWEEVLDYVNPQLAVPISVLTLNDLAIYPGIGLYFFYNMMGDLQYVGKCTSRSFIERVPSHFDCRKHAQFATVVKRMGGENSQSDDITVFSHKALNDLKLFLVNFTYDEVYWGDENNSKDSEKSKTRCEAELVEYLEQSIIYNTKPVLNRQRRNPPKPVNC